MIDVRRTLSARRRLIAISMIIALALLFVKLDFNAIAAPLSEYERYVHNYSNWTYVEKPVFPVRINESQIPIGQNWSIVSPLKANHSYHVYCYGQWVNKSSDPKTDYDIYVYNPNGEMETYHTESAGLPEHLGTTVDEPFFVPKYSGNYTFTIVNDPRESAGAQQATFIIIENIESNIWYSHYAEGKDSSNLPVFNTSWAYEFVTNSRNMEVLLKIPDTLDMYEARLYLMSDLGNETLVNDVPLAWEAGLYGNKSQLVGGYNLNSDGYRGVAYASCEYYGQDTRLNFTAPNSRLNVYHLVLIGEKGSGTVSFLVKTIFDACLQPINVPGKVYLDSNATVEYSSKSTDLLNATLQFSTNNWVTTQSVTMSIMDNKRTCTADIPAQAAGTQVSYRVTAFDVLDNVLVANGSYSVRQSSRTHIEKPMYPVFFSDSQIEIGRDWSIICPLEANHSYHVYFYGAWVNNGSDPKTDYDIYVYNPQNMSEGSHTESAGLPEHLGTTVDLPFFVPNYSGNYTFIIANDPRESKGAQQGTFMIIEDAECNVWHERYVEGKNSTSLHDFYTSWAYEFVTDSQKMEISVKVPDTMDMYEARLYLMSDPKTSITVNEIPLPWEQGLYGNRSTLMGGYNLDSEGYRGVIYASCEYAGQDMRFNFTSPNPGKHLYHLVLIGENGKATVSFLVKTAFNVSLQALAVLNKVQLSMDVAVAYVSKSTNLVNATLKYSTDGWRSIASSVAMNITDGYRTCRGVIPKYAAGTTISYRVEAFDVLDNLLVANSSYYVSYVQTFSNWTFVEKPMFAVNFSEGQILIGQNWTVVVPLEANRSYHVYCYGAWVHNGSEPKTDYDIYVYNPSDEMESYHTASAGVLENLGTTVNASFFVPRYSGNYSFVIVNDARESAGAQQATFMVIEDVGCNVWHEQYIEGKETDGLTMFSNVWAYEFASDSQRVEASVQVPDSLDMYEARLYLMSDPKTLTVVNGVPLAWEQGLYGNRSTVYGGYDLENRTYRGVTYASCEYYGQDMFLNFTAPRSGLNLYHLVLIGEKGNGTVRFLVRTVFDVGLQASILPNRVYTGENVTVAYVSKSTNLLNATLNYTTSNWSNATTLTMSISNNRTCTAVIPGQAAGTVVYYVVNAIDVPENVLTAGGNYAVKSPTLLNLTLINEAITLGDNIMVIGDLTPGVNRTLIRLYFGFGNESLSMACYSAANGSFTASFRPEIVGNWTVYARFLGDNTRYDSMSLQLIVGVEEPSFLAKYGLWIGGGAGGAAAAAAGIVFYMKKWRARVPKEEEEW